MQVIFIVRRLCVRLCLICARFAPLPHMLHSRKREKRRLPHQLLINCYSNLHATLSMHTIPHTQELVLDIYGEYAGRTGSLDYASYVRAVADHPVVVQFACGEGTERYGSD